MQRLHRVVGVLTLVAFLATGTLGHVVAAWPKSLR
jgi:hypothetical protein